MACGCSRPVVGQYSGAGMQHLLQVRVCSVESLKTCAGQELCQRFCCAIDTRQSTPHRNIAHAFFQPADNEMITLVHFNLRDSIMVGKKKTNDVQARQPALVKLDIIS